MQRVGHGDEAAMSELYDRFVGLVYKASRQVLASRAESEDAVQETFVRLWQTADRFDPNRAKLVTWVMLITRRHLIDRLRRKGARPEQLGLDSAVDFLGPSIPAPTDIGGEHDVEILRRRVAELPELQLQRNPNKLNPQFKPQFDSAANEKDAKRAIIDQVASLTDSSARRLAQEFVG